ncbi:hypothetical protein CR513_57443, partial [Mucuna pruriens]
MFGKFQTIINNIRSLVKLYDNYDHITKILQSFPRQWIPQGIQRPKEASHGGIFGTLKVHEIELNKDEGQRKGKSIALEAQNASNGSSSKVLKVEESFEEAFEGE